LASSFEFPAATTVTIFASTIALAAAFSEAEKLPPSDMDAITAGYWCFIFSSMTQFMPATTPESVPDPEHERTRTACTMAPVATP